MAIKILEIVKEAIINNYNIVGTTINGVYTLQADEDIRTFEL
jgi:hypothetical protein